MEKYKDSLRMKLLGKWGAWASAHWGKALLISLGITLVMGIGMSMVQMELTFYAMMPEGSRQVRDLKTITEKFPAASGIIVVVEALDKKNKEKAEETVKRAIDVLTEELSNPTYSEYVARVQGKMDMDFFKSHGVMLSKAEDIERMMRIYSDVNLVPLFSHLNDDFEREYSGDEDKLAEDEDMAVARFVGLQRILTLMERATSGEKIGREEASVAIDRFLFGSSYFMNRDSTMGLLFVQPTFTMNDLEMLMTGVPLIDRAARDRAAALGVTVGLTGATVVFKDEGVTSEKGLVLSMVIAVTLILLLMIVTFRMYSVPFISGIPLIVGLLWTLGMTGFIIGRLNIMTAMYMVALMGLGIDYAIHLLTTFMQERDDGQGFIQAVSGSMRKSGSGILLGALTTAVAFLMLMISKTGFIKELGFVAGVGILCELLAMFILVPALLGLRNYRLTRKGKPGSKLLQKLSFKTELMPSLGASIKRYPVYFALVMLGAAIVLGTQAGKVEIEGNMMNMEAKGLESIELQDRMVEEFGMAPDGLFVTMADLDEMRELGKRIKKLASVKAVESLAAYYPSREEDVQRRALAQKFGAELALTQARDHLDQGLFVEEIYRLEANLIEMADMAFMGGMDKMVNKLASLTGLNEEGQKIGNSGLDRLIRALETDPAAAEGLIDLQALFVPLLKQKLLQMANPQRITPEMIPPFISDSYRSEDGEDYLMSIVPTQNPWEEDFRKLHMTQLETITDKSTGMILAADQMTAMVEVDGIRAAVAALIAIFVLLLLDFRNLKLALATLVPLLFSYVSLFGIMALTGIKFDVVNFIAIPLLIGIGIDYAVHFNHRYLLEGNGNMDRVVAKTGAAVLMTTVTTIIAFASFIPSIMRAMRSTGIVLSVAMALAFIFSILFHPAVLIILSEKLGLNIRSWNFSRRKS